MLRPAQDAAACDEKFTIESLRGEDRAAKLPT
jgi:hypothetical protein